MQQYVFPVALICSLALSAVANAGQGNSSQPVAVVLNEVIEIAPVSANTDASAIFKDVYDYDGGLFLTAAAGNPAGSESPVDEFGWVVKSNRKFDVYVRAENPTLPSSNFMAYQGAANLQPGVEEDKTNMPLSTLLMKVTRTSAGIGSSVVNYQRYTGVNPKTNALTNGLKVIENGPVGVNTFSTSFKIAPGWSYKAGNYSAKVIFTATQL